MCSLVFITKCVVIVLIKTAHIHTAEVHRDVKYTGCYAVSFVEEHLNYYQYNHSVAFKYALRICDARLTTHIGIRLDMRSTNRYLVYCGNDLVKHSQLAEDFHCRTCGHNHSMTCGGPHALSIYKLREATPLAVLMGTSRGISRFTDDNAGVLELVNHNSVESLDYHYTDDQLRFLSGGKLFKWDLDLPGDTLITDKPVTIFEGNLAGLTINWLTSLMYVVTLGSNQQNSIVSILMNGVEKATEHTFTASLSVGNHQAPLVDPFRRMIFYVDETSVWSYEVDSGEASMMAKLKLGQYETPRIAVDVHSRVLYVALPYRVLALNYDRRGKTTVYSGGEVSAVQALDVFDGELVWVNKADGKHTLYTCPLLRLMQRCDIKSIKSLHSTTEVDIHDIKVYHPYRQTAASLTTLCGRQRDCLLRCCERVSLLETRCLCPGSKLPANQEGVFDDGSDKTTTAQPPIGQKHEGDSSEQGCKLPALSNNVFSLYPCSGNACRRQPGDSVAHSQLIRVSCVSGYQLAEGSSTYISCEAGVWDNSISQCYKLCPPLSSLTLKLECWQGPNQVSCGKPMLPNTTVRYECQEYHSPRASGQPALPRCQEGGAWSHPLPVCDPKCGQSNLNSVALQPAIVGGEHTQYGNFPWHAGIYHREADKWSNKCGGSLVSPRTVLTAAHCVTDRCDGCQAPMLAAGEVMVALGKNHRDWDTAEPTAIKRAVKEMHVPATYWGLTLNYDQDIAVVTLREAVPVSGAVMPVCIDRSNAHAHELTTGRLAYVVGWGKTVDCGRGEVCPDSDSLLYSTTPVLDFNTCLGLIQKINRTLGARLTADKMCSGNGSLSVIQSGDSGGGLIYRFGSAHFIYGIVSTRFKIDKLYSFGAFTNLPRYLDWVLSKIS